MEEEKKTLKERWNNWKPVKYFKEHPDIGLTVLGGALYCIGGVLKLYTQSHEYNDKVFVETVTGDICMLPAKKMETIDPSGIKKPRF